MLGNVMLLQDIVIVLTCLALIAACITIYRIGNAPEPTIDATVGGLRKRDANRGRSK